MRSFGLSYEAALDLPIHIFWDMVSAPEEGSLCAGLDRMATSGPARAVAALFGA